MRSKMSRKRYVGNLPRYNLFVSLSVSPSLCRTEIGLDWTLEMERDNLKDTVGTNSFF